MNWAVILIAFIFAVLAAAWVHGVLARRRPEWSERRLMIGATLALPILILIASVAGIAFVLVSGPGKGENMQDLAVAVIAAMGGLFSLVAITGGLVGVSLARRSGRP